MTAWTASAETSVSWLAVWTQAHYIGRLLMCAQTHILARVHTHTVSHLLLPGLPLLRQLVLQLLLLWVHVRSVLCGMCV